MKPDICVYVGEKQIRRQKSQRSLQNTLKIAGINTSLRFVAIDLFDFEEIRSSLHALLEEYRDMNCTLDVSGGNDLLLLAAGMCCANYAVQIISHKPGSNFFSCISGSHAGERQYYDLRLTQEQTIAMAGGELLRHGHIHPGNITEEAMKIIPEVFEVYRTHRERWPQFVQYLQQTDDPQYWVSDETDIRAPKKIYCGRYPVFGDLSILSDLSDIDVIHDIRISSQEYAFRYASPLMGAWLREVGIWLELYLYSQMIQSGLFDYVDINAVVSWDDTSDVIDTINEIDLIASAGIGRMFISCKTGVPDNAALNEIQTIARRFGGKYSVPVIATMCDLKREAPAVFRRAVEMGIVVLDADDLCKDALNQKLKSISRRWDQ